jgi:hypothetical protein
VLSGQDGDLHIAVKVTFDLWHETRFSE